MTSIPYESPGSTAPVRKPINLRLIAFLLIVITPLALIVYSAMRQSMSGGIINHGDYQEVNLKALGNFPLNATTGQLTDIPQRFRELDGKRVSLKGFVYRPDSAGARGNRFEFVYDVGRCCFNGPPQVQERVYAFAKTTVPIPNDYTILCELTGTLHVRIVRPESDGPISSVFDMDVESLSVVQ